VRLRIQFLSLSALPTAPVSSIMAANESRQPPIRIKRSAMLLPSPWQLGRPRRTLVPLRVQWIAQIHGCRFSAPTPCWLTLQAIRFAARGNRGQRHIHSIDLSINNDNLAVIPGPRSGTRNPDRSWIPAFAGMTLLCLTFVMNYETLNNVHLKVKSTGFSRSALAALVDFGIIKQWSPSAFLAKAPTVRRLLVGGGRSLIPPASAGGS
jgi:hypothetical protein